MEYLYKSPIGILLLKGNSEYLSGLFFVDDNYIIDSENNNKLSGELEKTIFQLDEYFASKRNNFDIILKTKDTPFREKVWKALMNIPFGKTISYKQLAENIEKPNAIRAVGGANHHNPISIIIPCHRVIGKNGKLVGYGGELWRKEWLLKHEETYCF